MNIILLVFLFQVKHFIADFVLQLPFKYLYGKFKYKDWILPLSIHCFIHSLFTFNIAIQFTKLNIALLCSLLDFVIHFTMDRIKASPNMLGKYESLTKNDYRYLNEQKIHAEKLGQNSKWIDDKIKDNFIFWITLGVDQLVHNLTDLLSIVIILWSLK